MGGFVKLCYFPSNGDNFNLQRFAARAVGRRLGLDLGLDPLRNLNLNFLLLFFGWRFCVSFSYLLLNHYRYYLIPRL